MPPFSSVSPWATSVPSGASSVDDNKSFDSAVQSLDDLQNGRTAQGRADKAQDDKDTNLFFQAQTQGQNASDGASPGTTDVGVTFSGGLASAATAKFLQDPLAPTSAQLSKVASIPSASPQLPHPEGAVPISAGQARTLLATTGIAGAAGKTATPPSQALLSTNADATVSPRAVSATGAGTALAFGATAPTGTYDKVLQSALATLTPAFNWQAFALKIEKSLTRFRAEDLLLRVQARQQNLQLQAKMRELGISNTQGKLDADKFDSIVALAKNIGFQTRLYQQRYPEALMAQDSSKRPSQIDLEPHLSSEQQTSHVKEDIARHELIEKAARDAQAAHGPLTRLHLPNASSGSPETLTLPRHLLSSGEISRLSPADRATYQKELLPKFYASHAHDVGGQLMAFQHEVNVLNSAATKVSQALRSPGLTPEVINRLTLQKTRLESTRDELKDGELKTVQAQLYNLGQFVGRHPNASGDVGRGRAHQEAERQAIITELQETTFVAKAGSDKTPDQMRAEAMGHKRNLDLRVIALDGFLSQFAWDSKDNKSARWHSGAPSVANTLIDTHNRLKTLKQESLRTPEDEPRRLERLGLELVLSRMKGLNQSSMLEINEKHYDLLSALSAPHGDVDKTKQELKTWAQTSDISRERMLRHFTDRRAALETSLVEAKAGADPQRAFHERDAARHTTLLEESKHLNAMESFWKTEVAFRIDHRNDTGLRNLTFGSLRTAIDLRAEQKTMKRSNAVAPEMRAGNVLKTPTWADGSPVDFTSAKEAETYYDAAARAGGSIMGDTTRGQAYGAYRNRYFETLNASFTGNDFWIRHVDQKYNDAQYQSMQRALNEGVAQISDLERKGAARMSELQNIASDMATQIINIAFSPVR